MYKQILKSIEFKFLLKLVHIQYILVHIRTMFYNRTYQYLLEHISTYQYIVRNMNHCTNWRDPINRFKLENLKKKLFKVRKNIIINI